MSDPLNHLGSIWYHLEPLGGLYSPNQFLGWGIFFRFLEQTGSRSLLWNIQGTQLNLSNIMKGCVKTIKIFRENLKNANFTNE